MQQYTVTGMHCAACSASVEKAVKKVPGVESCAVSLLTNSMGTEGTAAPDAIIASSTSGLLVTEIAKNAEHPERFCGGHPYNPPHLIPLVEITKGEKTADATVECAKAFYARIGMAL